MKKMVLRVLSIMMIAAIMVLSTNSVAALAAENLDISSRVFVSDAAPADNADGSITFSDQKSMKCSFALPTVLNAGESVTVNVKLQFDSADDAGVRFYLISGGVDVNTAVAIESIANEGVGSIVEKTFTLTAASASTELLFASASYGVYLNNVTIHEISIGEKEAEVPEAPAADADLVALDLSSRVFLSGASPVDNADGSITFSGQATMKSSFALPETLVAGDSINVNVKMKFDSEADAGVRFYLIANGVDSNLAAEIQAVAAENIGSEIEKSFVLTAASDSTEILFASSSYGVNIDNVTLYEITLGEKPVAETPAVDTPIEITGNEYIVQAGDTLGKIAAASGLSVKEIADANNIEDADMIMTGAKLVLPTVDTAKRHIVVAGDTLGKLAATYGCTVDALVSANAIEDADMIYVGQLIVLP